MPQALVIDDDVNLSEIFARALDLAGFETEILNDSTIALDRISAQRPALVTLDMQMPVVPGDEILRQIRADETLKHTRVMLVTANERASDTQEIDLLADVILIKPVTLTQIKEIAMRLMNIPIE
jgi:CheY-like chemotaxis protein